MCGIAGMFYWGAEPPIIDWDKVGNTITHRGPDGQGRFVSEDRRYVSEFRRLAIIDLSTGDQPIQDPRANRVVTGNGEIYNYRELRERFCAYPYTTLGDMETVLAARESLGKDGFLDVLNGMYALALYDADTHSLDLIRDRAGVKPLYWAKIHGGMVYASEIKPLLATGQVPAEINENAVNAYLQHGYVPGPETILRNVFKLGAGERLRISADGSIDIATYWTPAPADHIPSDRIEVAEYLTALLDDSVGLQLRSDVPVGTLLSGGLDSGLLVALAAAKASHPLKTFTVRFSGADYDETPLAGEIANRYGTDHTVLEVNAADADTHLPKIAWFAEEPLNDAAFLPNYLIEQALGAHVKVALNGTGGDELFAGYGRYFQLPIERRYLKVPQFLRAGAIEPVVHTLSPMRAWQLSRAQLFDANPGAYLNAHSTHFPSPIRGIIENEMAATSSAQERYATAFADRWTTSRQTTALVADIQTYLVEDLLTLLDKSSMAVSVEGRVPFLDHRLIEAALAVPPDIRTPGDRQKGLERQMAATYLPESVLNARKQGFVSPVPSWMKGAVGKSAHRILTHPDILSRGWWSSKGISALSQSPERHGYRLYSLLMLALSVHTLSGTMDASPPKFTLREFADA